MIVNSVLELSREGLRRREPVDIGQAASEAFNLLQWEIDNSNVIGRLEVESNVEQVEGDRDQILQALINLMQNGIHAMPDGGMLTVRIRSSEGWLVIDIEDTGTGMSEEERASVFQPF